MAKSAPFVIGNKQLGELVDNLGVVKHKLDKNTKQYKRLHKDLTKKCKDGRIVGERYKALIYTVPVEHLVAGSKAIIKKYVPKKLHGKIYQSGPVTTVCLTNAKDKAWKKRSSEDD